MKVDVVNFSNNIPDEKMNGSVVLLIDVLRCTSCIVTALANGASSVVVFAGVDEARNYAERLGSKLRVGRRKIRPPHRWLRRR